MASELIVDGDTIYLDPGSTCTMILKYILKRKLRFILRIQMFFYK